MGKEDEAYDFARYCVWNGVSPQEAISLLREAWMIVLEEEKRRAEREFQEKK